MGDFEKIQKIIKKQFDDMSESSDFLYTLNLEKNELWEVYLNNFPEGKNEIFRERRVHDCSACRHFFNSFGDVVVIKDNKIVSIWDVDIVDDEYSQPIKAVSDYIKGKSIKDVYLSKFSTIGTKENFEQYYEGVIQKWTHYYVTLPNKFVNNSNKSIDTILGDYRSIKDVFKRSLEELSQESVLTVLELIAQGSLYRGEEWKNQLVEFNKYQKEYELLSDSEKDTFVWSKLSVGIVIGKIRNHSIGTLLINITEGMDLDIAVRKYEQIVAPTNYKRPKPIYSKKMLEDAKKKIEELGFMDSLQRRHAIIEDISINNVLFSNKDNVKKMQTDDVFGEMEQDIPINPKSFNKIEEIGIDDFIKNVLPITKNIEVLVENKHTPNMVSLIAPKKQDSKTMFKWDNNFSWAYSGNIADSDMKKNVKSAGGKVDGVLRFSIQWNELGKLNRDDYDAHCIEPMGNEIMFSNNYNHSTLGNLDIDITDPKLNTPALENITWSNKDKMEKGTYKLFVHNYSNRGGSDGFRAEIEFNGQIYKFEYNKELRHNENIQVAEVTFDGENFTIKELLKSEMSSRKVWNLNTNQFVPVSIMMYSPNYWNEQKGIDNKHYFFMLKGCVNEETPNGFFNEYLNNELNENRKVFEALGSKLKVDTIDNQLSGIGFSNTQRNQVIVKVEGQTKRVLKVNF